MKPNLQEQVISWCIALAGLVLSHFHELFLALVVVAALLRHDIQGKEVFNHLLGSYPRLCIFSFGYIAISTAVILWFLNSGGQSLLKSFGSSALWFALWPLVALFALHEHQVYKSNNGRT